MENVVMEVVLTKPGLQISFIVAAVALSMVITSILLWSRRHDR